MMIIDQATAIVGQSNIDAISRVNCEPTNRVGFNGACQDNELTEWAASLSCVDVHGEPAILIAYYYTTADEDQRMADAGGDGTVIDWTVDHYDVV